MSDAMGGAGRARGLTLAELLVALAAGLGVLLAAGRLLLAVNDAYAAQAERAAVDDGGRYALEVLGRALRQAGQVEGLDARTLAHATPALDHPLADAVGGSDVLAVRFPGSGPAPDGDGSALDCAGFAFAEGEEGWSVFYVARNAQGEAELRCKYRGAANWSSDAIVAGVDGFQVLYGIDTDTPPDGIPNRYVNADAILALDAAAPHQPTWWRRVASVRVGLLLHGTRPMRPDGTAVYHLLGTSYAAAAGADDGGSSLRETDMAPGLRRRERRLFTTTVGRPPPVP